MYEMWELFTPQAVVMACTTDEDGKPRCSPFSWLVPVNKGRAFAMMARHESGTLKNLRRDGTFTLAWVHATPELAEAVLYSKAPEPRTVGLWLERRRGMSHAYPAAWVRLAACVVQEFLSMAMHLPGAPDTHTMVLAEVDRAVMNVLLPKPCLLHIGRNVFATYDKIEVPPY
jgi:flavin reductase (DIM6/NTAB) family NADH-FMN oxidoreductase RutF